VTPFADAAHAYLDAGWWPIYVADEGGKAGIPSGFTGTNGRRVTRDDVRRWVSERPGANIALRLPPDIVAVDVDAYDDKPGADTLAELEARLGALPGTWVATARSLPAGKLLFRVPAGTRLRSTMGPGIDVCQHHHRYVVVAPSVHHSGAAVRWIDSASGEIHDEQPRPEDIPDLPWAWLEEFSASGSGDVALAATTARVDEWIDAGTQNLRPKWLDATVARLRDAITSGESRHDSMLTALCSVAREVEAGAFDSGAALTVLVDIWEKATKGEGRGEEFTDMLAWAVGQLDTETGKAEVAAKRERLVGPQPTATPKPPDEPGDHSPLLLPASFWAEREVLGHIREAAIARMTPPDAVLHAVLARVAALSSHTLELPPNVGGGVGLSYMTMLVGRAGNGKSTAIATARDLLPAPANHNIADGLPIGSGEGLAEVLFDMREEPDPDTGKKVKVRRQVRHNALVAVDEGTLLAELGQRKGTTVLSTLRTIYTHGTIGNTNASLERRRIVPGYSYVYGLIVGIQPSLAGPLLDPVEIAAGTPQRFSWVWCVDPTLTPDLHPWPGALDWEPHGPGALNGLERIVAHGAAVRHRLPVPAEVTMFIRKEIHRGRTTDEVDDLDAHLMLQRLKLAALLGILDGRLEVSVDDWRLSGVIIDTSRAVRDHVVEVLRYKASQEERSQTDRVIRREAASEDAAYMRALASAVSSVARKVRRDGKATKRTLTQAISGKHRRLGVTFDEVISKALEEGLVGVDGTDFVPGRRAA
jgi:hypothetical protein